MKLLLNCTVKSPLNYSVPYVEKEDSRIQTDNLAQYQLIISQPWQANNKREQGCGAKETSPWKTADRIHTQTPHHG